MTLCLDQISRGIHCSPLCLVLINFHNKMLRNIKGLFMPKIEIPFFLLQRI